MSILFDYSGCIHAAVHVDIATSGGETSQEMIRHLILNQIRAINKKFAQKYGDLVICLDSSHVWRKDIDKYYKFRRAVSRAEDTVIDWSTVFGWVNTITNEIREYLPYKVVSAPRSEGDDVIATLIDYILSNPNIDDLFGDSTSNEKILIVSNDKDLKQLHVHKNVEQYYPLKNIVSKEPNPQLYLFEQICRGDSGDGVPNIKSPLDIFTKEGSRQKPVSAKNIKEWYETGIPMDLQSRFNENKQLIDLSSIPETIKQEIVTNYKNAKSGDRSKLWIYFEKFGLKRMNDMIGDF